jgi:glycosyltransferase involved in cell wall biosynthesis
MAAGNAIIAHDNAYNRWVAGPDHAYFSGGDALARLLPGLLADEHRRARMGAAARARFRAEFTWPKIGAQYERALLDALARRGSVTEKMGAVG